jgi:hypothetical protein
MAANIAEARGAKAAARALPELFAALPARLRSRASPGRPNAGMESNEARRPALPLLVLLAVASALGVAVAIALAGLAMLLATPAYAGEGSLLLERHGSLAPAERLSAESESFQDGHQRVVETYHNSFAEPLEGVYVFRLPRDAVLERLIFTLGDGVVPRQAVLTWTEGAALVEHAGELGAGETLRVELEYRRRSLRRLLAL